MNAQVDPAEVAAAQPVRPSEDIPISKRGWAMFHAANGFPVFRLNPNTKLPLGFGWQSEATTDLAAVQRLWSRPDGSPADFNIGIATGDRPNGRWVVVDCDCKPKLNKDGTPKLDADGKQVFGKGRDALETWDMLDELPHGYRQTTASGGRHVILALPEGQNVRNSSHKIAPDVDVRGQGGLIVAAGSTIDGKVYTWDGGSRDEMPADFVRMCGRPIERSDNAQKPLVELDQPRNIERATRYLIDEAPEAAVGAGANDTIYRVACQVKDFGISRAMCADLMGEHYNEAGKVAPTLPHDEIADICGNAYVYGARPPGVEDPAAEFHPDPDLEVPDAEVRATPVFAAGVSEDALALGFTRETPDARFDHDAGAWYLWDSERWVIDGVGSALSRLREIARREAATLKDGERLKAGGSRFVAGAERFARSDPRHAVRADVWDADPWLLGVPGGVVDLRTGMHRAADPRAMVTKQTAVAPDQRVPTRWLAFLNEATGGDDGTVGFLRRFAGYALSGSIKEHVFVFLYGGGGNGKSVFIETLSHIFGEYTTTSSTDAFTASRGDRHPTEMAGLKGARLVVASETGAGKAWDETKIKQLTGGDKVAARFMNKDFFTFTPQFKLLVAGNHQPKLGSVDDAMRRRLRVVPFTTRPATPDPDLLEKLKDEAPAILSWMIEGCLEWQRDGLGASDAMTDATSDYFETQDVIGTWLEERCDARVGDHEISATAHELFEDWSTFARLRREDPGTQKAFAEELKRRGFSKGRRTIGGVKYTVWSGLGLSAPTVDEFHPASVD